MRELTLSKWAVEKVIIEQEVSSKENYEARLQFPVFPGYLSGVTIGLGLDLAHCTPAELSVMLMDIISPIDIATLSKYCGYIGIAAKTILHKYPCSVRITWAQAQKIFYRSTLKKYAVEAASVYPELEELHPYEQTAIVGLIYNRGSKLTDKKGDDRRKEMRMLVQAIKDDNDKLMAAIVRQMKRLWDANKMGGLIKRRELEAHLLELPDDPIPEDDILRITV